jgi:2-amino-4-hydroxy-6-hydroxymethyldihydropteridine diphosphokinase
MPVEDDDSRADSRSVVAFVAVGSNIDPERNIEMALRKLQQSAILHATSTFYRTPPLERPDRPMFVNGVCKISSGLPARQLKFQVLRRIEHELGRERVEDRHAPRTIDLDLIIYGDSVIEEEGLLVPDPDIRRRAFIAVPLLELAPGLQLPGTLEPLAPLPVAQSMEGLVPLVSFSEQLRQRLMS